MASLDVRRAQFARFVRRATSRAQESRGWSIPKIAEMSDGQVGVNTLYRWLAEDWTRAPLADQVAAFCNVLDIPPAIAFGILWPGKDDSVAEPEPLPTSPAVDLILRKLNDPNVPEPEKYHIRQTLESLAARPRSPRS